MSTCLCVCACVSCNWGIVVSSNCNHVICDMLFYVLILSPQAPSGLKGDVIPVVSGQSGCANETITAPTVWSVNSRTTLSPPPLMFVWSSL